MSLIAVAVATMLAVAFARLAADVADASLDKGRAQLAADAAALAAVAESGPYGNGAPVAEARRLAAANGASLTECACEAGATAVQVTVELEGVTARARAVIDPAAIEPASLGLHLGGLHPVLAGAVTKLLDAARGAVWVESGYRSTDAQARLWHAALQRHGSAEAADDWVARPGRSMHEQGMAVDLGGDLDLALRLSEELNLPLYRPLVNEPWHFELLGSRG